MGRDQMLSEATIVSRGLRRRGMRSIWSHCLFICTDVCAAWRGTGKTAGVALVVDDLTAWLVALLADAGRKKLTSWVLGTDQQRALRQAAEAAVERTAEQLALAGGEQAEQLAMVVSEVFHEPTPDAAVARQATLLEALQAGIVGKLAVLGAELPRVFRTGNSAVIYAAACISSSSSMTSCGVL